jgi:small subunit ribosomal protein S4
MATKFISGCKKCRQTGEKLCSRGPKCVIERRSLTPGQHGKKIGTKKLSEYGKQLQEKQKVKLHYSVLERQFRRFFEIAAKSRGVTGENLLSLLERRLDNTVYRLKMTASRLQARQLVVHGHILVNGKRVKSPSSLLVQGDVVSLGKQALNSQVLLDTMIDKRMNMGIKVPEWLELSKKDRAGTVLRLPVRSDVTLPVEEHLIVELYSK